MPDTEGKIMTKINDEEYCRLLDDATHDVMNRLTEHHKLEGEEWTNFAHRVNDFLSGEFREVLDVIPT